MTRNPFRKEALFGVRAKHSAKELCFSCKDCNRMLYPYRYRYSIDGFGMRSSSFLQAEAGAFKLVFINLVEPTQ